jgi:eukaryotic-like serine/threonine-protein kinase
VFDSGITPAGVAYLVMELLEGRSLAEELVATGPLTLGRCAAILSPVCDALAHAHGLGILHRDVKPGNIFLHRGPAGEVVKVVDFGIAKLFGDAAGAGGLTTTGRIMGTPVYMPPERLLGKPHDERSDTYGVAVTLYQMISGRLPFELGEGNLAAVVMACLTEAPTPLHQVVPDVAPEIEQVVMQAMAREAADRPTVSELARAFAEAVASAPARDQPLGSTVELMKPFA